MSDQANTTPVTDPFRVLGLAVGAGEDEVRARYLELVKEFPPEQDPQKFRDIHQAYEAARDPLRIAVRLLGIQQATSKPWSEVINEQRAKPPRIPVNLLLSLGN